MTDSTDKKPTEIADITLEDISSSESVSADNTDTTKEKPPSSHATDEVITSKEETIPPDRTLALLIHKEIGAGNSTTLGKINADKNWKRLLKFPLKDAGIKSLKGKFFTGFPEYFWIKEKKNEVEICAMFIAGAGDGEGTAGGDGTGSGGEDGSSSGSKSDRNGNRDAGDGKQIGSVKGIFRGETMAIEEVKRILDEWDAAKSKKKQEKKERKKLQENGESGDNAENGDGEDENDENGDGDDTGENGDGEDVDENDSPKKWTRLKSEEIDGKVHAGKEDAAGDVEEGATEATAVDSTAEIKVDVENEQKTEIDTEEKTEDNNEKSPESSSNLESIDPDENVDEKEDDKPALTCRQMRMGMTDKEKRKRLRFNLKPDIVKIANKNTVKKLIAEGQAEARAEEKMARAEEKLERSEKKKKKEKKKLEGDLSPDKGGGKGEEGGVEKEDADEDDTEEE